MENKYNNANIKVDKIVVSSRIEKRNKFSVVKDNETYKYEA